MVMALNFKLSLVTFLQAICQATLDVEVTKDIAQELQYWWARARTLTPGDMRIFKKLIGLVSWKIVYLTLCIFTMDKFTDFGCT